MARGQTSVVVSKDISRSGPVKSVFPIEAILAEIEDFLAARGEEIELIQARARRVDPAAHRVESSGLSEGREARAMPRR